MKRQSDEEKFVSELLGDEGELSRTILEHGLTAMRRKRARRRAWRTACVLAPIGAMVALLVFEHFRTAHSPAVQVSQQSPAAPEVIAGTSIRVLSDAELLDFFKGRPVALVGRSGNQRLILFDESR